MLDKKIKSFYFMAKSRNVKRAIVPGNSGSLWKAVKIAKDVNIEPIPATMFENKIEIPPEEKAERFARFFDSKIKDVLKDTKVDENVYNERRKVVTEEKIFMDKQ